MDHTALLIIDIQNDYFPGGKMELDKADEAAQNATALLDHFRKENAPIFHIQHESMGENASFFIPGTQGQKINEQVTPP
jgi:nicotinamidase-related amidase